MDIQMRRNRTAQIQDQENIHVIRGKANVAIPTNHKRLSVQGALLGNINANVQPQRQIEGKVAVAAVQFKKRATQNLAGVKSNYSHVRSKVDSGLPANAAAMQPSARPPLRREESAAGHASRDAAHNRAILKDAQNRPAEQKQPINFYKKFQESKKILKQKKIYQNTAKKIIVTEPKKSLRKLKLKEELEELKTYVDAVELYVLLKIMRVPANIEDIYKYLTELKEKDHSRKHVCIVLNNFLLNNR